MGYIVKLPRDTMVTVGNESFKLLDHAYATGSLDDFDSIKHLLAVALKAPKCRKGRL